MEEELRDRRDSDSFPKLTDVIAKINNIAELNDDKKFSNIEEIFNQLTIKEKTVLVKGIMDILNLSETLHKHLFENNNSENIVDIEQFNKIELIKLKSWFTKSLFLFLMPIFIIFIVMVYFMDPVKSVSLPSAFDDFFKVIKLLFI